jgi:hypothetical protein
MFFIGYEKRNTREVDRDYPGQAVTFIRGSWPLRVEERAEHRRPLLFEVGVPLESAL